MIPFILRNVNVRLFRRYCSVLSDEGVQFETARVFNSIAVFIKRGELKKSIDKDKEHDKNTEEKEAILRSIDDEFFKYYYEYNDEQST